jgi:hypothetical protein
VVSAAAAVSTILHPGIKKRNTPARTDIIDRYLINLINKNSLSR